MTEKLNTSEPQVNEMRKIEHEVLEERERCIHLYIALTNDTDEHMQKVVRALRGR